MNNFDGRNQNFFEMGSGGTKTEHLLLVITT